MAGEIVRLVNNVNNHEISKQAALSHAVKAERVRFSLDHTTHAAVSHQLVPMLSTQTEKPQATRFSTASSTKCTRKTKTVSTKAMGAPASATALRPVATHQELIYVKNLIAQAPITDVCDEEDPEIIEAIFDVLQKLYEGKINCAKSMFNVLTASNSNLLTKFRYHLRNLDDDSLEFCADLTKTKQALFAIAYQGRNAQGKPNKYFSPSAMDAWFSDLNKILKEEKKTKF